MLKKMTLTSQNSSSGSELIPIQPLPSFTSTLKHSTDIFSLKRLKNSISKTSPNSSLMLRMEKLQALLMLKLKPKKLKTQNKSNKQKLRIKKPIANKVKNQMIIRKNFDVLFMIFVSNNDIFRFYYKSIKIYFYFSKKSNEQPSKITDGSIEWRAIFICFLTRISSG